MKRLLLPALVAAMLGLAGCYTNPVTGRKSLVLLSEGEEVTLGAQSLPHSRGNESEADRMGAIYEQHQARRGE